MIGIGRVVHRAFLVPEEKEQAGTGLLFQELSPLDIRFRLKHFVLLESVKELYNRISGAVQLRDPNGD
jgi:hypothetical protein